MEQMPIKVSEHDVILHRVLNNLIAAHDRISRSGKPLQILCVSWMVMRLAKKRKNVMIEVVPEDEQNWRD